MRKAGILLPISALKDKYGIGGFSSDAYEFVDWLSEAGQSYWQILPLGPTSFGDSPYQSFSSFAGNPYYISLDDLVFEGLLKKEEIAEKQGTERAVDYKWLFDTRIKILKKAFSRFDIKNEEYFSFVTENIKWLENYALFMALKSHYGGLPWYEWDFDIKMYQEKEIEKLLPKIQGEIDFWKFVQYKFYSQWYKLKEYANSKGIKIIGDIPIYVSYDSVDVWSEPALFELESDKTPINVAGCPPDGFSKQGQLWGNPLYKWDVHLESGFLWWIERLNHCFKMYDTVRIDHFRGFDEYYSISYGSKDATNGKWEKAPGRELFKKVREKLGKKEIIAEDLGFVTDTVKELLDYCEFPGMKVFQFGFDERDMGSKNDYLPHNYQECSVAYTGTHDNPTIVSWFFEINKNERAMVRNYLCDYHTPDSEINFPIIGAIMRSRSNLVIIPLQDYLGYDSRSRINKPSTIGSNWTWRTTENDFSKELQTKIRIITKMTGRI
ncbi:MAG: 4-alpha-glucanotransferase [Clostridia bacterium]|nr:4-alpha-glucanotransferase [Clostridia bacterium]